MLERYRNEPTVFQISASNFQDTEFSIPESYYFSRYNHIWGWATWKKNWQHFNVALHNFEKAAFKQKLKTLFPTATQRKYWELIYNYVQSGNLDTWDFQWMFTMWMHDGLGIIPKINLVSNIGFGNNATNTTSAESRFAEMVVGHLDFPLVHPVWITINQEADRFTEDDLFGVSRSAKTYFLKLRLAALISLKQKKWLKKTLKM